MLCGISSHNEFATVMVDKLKNMGVIENDKVDTVSLLTPNGNQKSGGVTAVVDKIAKGESPATAAASSSVRRNGRIAA